MWVARWGGMSVGEGGGGGGTCVWVARWGGMSVGEGGRWSRAHLCVCVWRVRAVTLISQTYASRKYIALHRIK